MSNKKLYKEAFSKLHASNELDLEGMKMKNKKSGFRCGRKLLAVSMILVVMMAMTCVVNAATGGQLADNVKIAFNHVKLFVNGEEVDIESQSEDGNIVLEMDNGDSAQIKDEDNGTEVDANAQTKSKLTVDKDGNSQVDIKDAE